MSTGFKTATVTAAKVAATLTDYPSFIDPARVGMANLTDVQSSRVYLDSGKVVEAPRDALSTEALHTKISSLTSTTAVYVDWDGVRTDYAASATYGSEAVWSDYSVVYHLNSTTDATGNGNTLTAGGGVTTGGDTSSPFGYGTSYDGANDYHYAADSADFNALSGSYTLQSWMYSSSAVAADPIFGQYMTGSPRWAIRLEDSTLPSLYARNATTTIRPVRSTTAIASSVWLKVDVTGTAGTTADSYFYRNAVDVSDTKTSQTTGMDSSDQFQIAATSTTIFSQIKVAEVRIRKSVLSANWITTEHNNQDDESAFWGTWSDVGGGGAPAQNSNFLMFM